MDAAVLHEHGSTPRFGAFAEPVAGPGQVVVEVAAAALHPLDLHKATGTFYTGPPPLPSVVGTDGVGRLADGRRVYFNPTVPPHGSMAERTVMPEELLFGVPDGIDDAVAAAIGNPGMAAWLALADRAQLQPGETVLVLGATGATGNIAVQAARILGAGRVVAAARPSERLDRLIERGADAVVELGGDPTDAIRAATDGGPDVTVDLLWGEPALAAMRAAALHARHVQIGNSAGPSIVLDAPAIRSLSLDVRGFSLVRPTVEARRAAYGHVAEHVRRGEIVVDVDPMPLDRVAAAWERQREEPGGAKIVLLVGERSQGT